MNAPMETSKEFFRRKMPVVAAHLRYKVDDDEPQESDVYLVADGEEDVWLGAILYGPYGYVFLALSQGVSIVHLRRAFNKVDLTRLTFKTRKDAARAMADASIWQPDGLISVPE